MWFVFLNSNTSFLKAFQWLCILLCWACLTVHATEPIQASPRSNPVRHWAYQTPRRPKPPELSGVVGNPIDAFVRSKLALEGIDPSPQASPETLIRRVSLDLTGLPPTPEEVEAFHRDFAPGAYERWVDRLLASPHFGERMAWDWLEAARYADSNGYQGDGERTMWPWRDWVIKAVNQNLPFDQFTQWQLAGDLLPQPTLEHRIATGFLRNHMINGEGGRIPEENRIEYLFDQTETVATVWLGSTFNCTRCHDHKYDPFTQKEYFSLLAFFNRTAVDGSGGDPQSRPVVEVPSEEQSKRRQALEARIGQLQESLGRWEKTRYPRPDGRPSSEATGVQELPKEILEILQQPSSQWDNARLERLAAYWKDKDEAYVGSLTQLKQARNERDALIRSIPRVMVMEDVPQPRESFVLLRGAYNKTGAHVEAAVPAVLNPFPTGAPNNRLGLARWLLQSEQPLTARVTVNRAWQMLFGVGLVKTSEDFGLQGERPIHADLLDWLATEFVDSGWDVKNLYRRIVTSATYRQSSRVTAEAYDRDPENRLLARGPRFRMPSWMIRDVILAQSGLLVQDMGGSPVKIYQPAGVWEEATFGNKRYEQDHGAALYRRSLYVFWRRIVGPTLFFDVATRQTCTVKTPRTNVPLHALMTLNDVGYVEMARALATRLISKASEDSDRIVVLYGWVLGRKPSPEEQRVLSQALSRHWEAFSKDTASARQLISVGESLPSPILDPSQLAAWTVICNTVLNLDESLTKE